METLLRFLRTHCAKLALSDMGSLLQALFHKLKSKKSEPMACWCTRYRNEHTKVRRALARLQRISHHWEFTCGIGPSITWDGCSDAGSNAWSRWNWSTWSETQTMHIEDYDEAPPLFPESVLTCFFHKKSGLEACGRNMILAATGNIPTGSGETSHEDTVSR